MKGIQNDPSKPLSNVPKRLQVMKLKQYDIGFKFIKGDNLILADTLSKAHLPDIVKEEGRPHIMNVHLFVDISDARISEVKEATAIDEIFQTLSSFTLEKWLD